MSFPDWGNVPGWLGAGSLLIAFRIFLRDRSERERTQVDLVGVWCIPQYERRSPIEPRVEEGNLKWFVRNGSQQPVEVAQIAYEVGSKWFVRDLAQWLGPESGAVGVWDMKLGGNPIRAFLGSIRVAPLETWHQECPVNVAHQAPDHSDQLDVFDGLTYKIRWILLVDNAGRRWEARPGAGRRTRRIRWCSWRRRDYPLFWRQPITLWLNRKRYQAWGWGRRVVRTGLKQLRRITGGRGVGGPPRTTQ